MQHSDDRPTTSGRPSLLSSEQQAEANRHRILSGLDAKPTGTTAGAGKARRSKFTWVFVGAAVLALGAGSIVWLTAEGEKEIVLAGTAPLPSTAAPAVALAAEPPTASPQPEEVSTATILDDTPMVATPAPPAKAATGGPDELTKLLEPGGAPLVMDKPAAAPVRVAQKAPVKRPVVAAKAAPKPRVQQTEMAMNVQPVLKKKPAVQTKKPAVQTDTDVALLAALVAHSKAKEPKRSTPAAKLQQCKALGSVAEAEQCRARLCASTAKKEAQCKAPSLAKASSET